MDDLEPMDVDISSSSASKMDMSCSDIDLSIVKKEKDTGEHYIATYYEDTDKESDLTLLRNFIKQDKNTEETTTFKMEAPMRTMPQKTKKSPKKFNFQNAKRFHIKLNHKQVKNTSPGLKTYWCIISLIALIISIITYHVIGYKCLETFDLHWIEEKLSKNLYGQTKAINDIITALDTNAQSKIIILYGGTGVGKTYATSMILENIMSSSNVYHFTMPSFSEDFSAEYLFGVTVCNNSLVVIDDLSIKDVEVIRHIEDIVSKSKNLRKNMTIILVYNTDIVTKGFNKVNDEEFLQTLQHSLSSVDSEKFFIKFDQLKIDNLIECIIKECRDRGIAIDETMLEEILMHFNVTQDGCKSVYSKINFLTDT